MKCTNKQGHVYQKVDSNTWQCVYCPERKAFVYETKEWK